jgi:hypothetical protein
VHLFPDEVLVGLSPEMWKLPNRLCLNGWNHVVLLKDGQAVDIFIHISL